MARTIPNIPEIVPLLTRALTDDELRSMKETPNSDDRSVLSKWTGYVRLERGKDTLLLDVEVAGNEYWERSHGPQQAQQLLAALIKTVAGKVFILINETLRIAAKTEAFVDIVSSILAHEAGHLLAGHFIWQMRPKIINTLPDEPEAQVFPTEENADVTPYFTHLSTALLAGGVFDMEYEADRYAAGLVGIASVIAMLADQMCASDNLSVRLEFQNRIERHIEDLRKGAVAYPTERIAMAWYVCDDDELEEFKKKKDETPPPPQEIEEAIPE